MKKLFYLLTVILLGLLQLNWPGFLSFFNSRPDLLLIFAVSAVIYLDFKSAFVLGAFCGLIKDVFLTGVFGTNILLFCALCYLVFRLSRQLSTETDLIRLGLVCVAVLLSNVVNGIQSAYSGGIPAGIFLGNLFFSTGYTLVLSPLVFKLTRKIAE